MSTWFYLIFMSFKKIPLLAFGTPKEGGENPYIEDLLYLQCYLMISYSVEDID